tara:strand:+ start:29263 stop:29742 length:480 start_codon:yes stop_codon:yes gene_type:complete
MLIDWERFFNLNNKYGTLNTETDKEMVERLEKTKIRKESVTRVSKTRTLLKAISWRVVGTLDTMALGWIVTGSPLLGLKIGALELVTKFVLYYFHERMWLRSVVGIRKTDGNGTRLGKSKKKVEEIKETLDKIVIKKRKSKKEIEQTIEDAVQDFFTNH